MQKEMTNKLSLEVITPTLTRKTICTHWKSMTFLACKTEFKDFNMKTGGQSDLMLKKNNKHYLIHVIEINSNANHVNSIDLWYDVIRMSLYLCSLPPHTHNFSLTLRLSDNKTQEILRNYHNQKGPKETWPLNLMFYSG